MFEKWAWAADVDWGDDDEFVNTTGRRPSEILEENRAVIRRIVAASKASNPRIFGSVLDRSDTVKSDLDILIDVERGFTLFDLGGLIFELQEALHIPVDVKTPGDLPIKWRESVVSAAVPV